MLTKRDCFLWYGYFHDIVCIYSRFIKWCNQITPIIRSEYILKSLGQMFDSKLITTFGYLPKAIVEVLDKYKLWNPFSNNKIHSKICG